MRFASLGSGSGGNALLIESGSTRILLDCGFGLSEVTARLDRLGVEPESLAAVIVTHEHDDHGGGVPRLASRHELPVYLTHGTLAALGAERRSVPSAVLIDTVTPFAIGALEVRTYPVPPSTAPLLVRPVVSMNVGPALKSTLPMDELFLR